MPPPEVFRSRWDQFRSRWDQVAEQADKESELEEKPPFDSVRLIMNRFCMVSHDRDTKQGLCHCSRALTLRRKGRSRSGTDAGLPYENARSWRAATFACKLRDVRLTVSYRLLPTFCLLLCACGGASQDSEVEQPDLVDKADLLDIVDVIPDAQLDIRYATPNNFVGVAVYPKARCLLQRRVAKSLLRVSERVHEEGYRLRNPMSATLPNPSLLAGTSRVVQSTTVALRST